ncbi:LysR family transcriptional regulator [Paenibacillus sepulcri]|uniref:LysR family transcriptional regulator n=1 Tax=Paenibacillus sepulcri TaxID=359917 RepID=A0ABS7CCM2_9BACL|nr:LysR family transcriptional regulator [Paenibacillus sepulcri]
MELTQLDYFLTVARLQHMTKASEALSITQPALSHAISKLETELGVPLFDRKGRNVQVNRYGSMFAKRVERAIQEITKGKQEIDEWSNPETGVIGIAYLNILGADLLPKLVRDYQLKHPQVRFELTQGNYELIYNQLDNGYSDLMITSERPATDNYEWRLIKSLPLYAVVSNTHRLADRASLSLTELTGEPFVGLDKNCGLKSSLLTRFQHMGFTLTATYDAEDLTTVAGFVAAGLGVSVLPRSEGLAVKGMAWLPIEEEGWIWEVGLYWRKDRYQSPASKRFIDYIESSSFQA